ncbi:DUF3450 family protein [Algimonas porphyrae]|uniref:DUF3450 family protein n=1 Tax=Algimonas porphyrae TaxID=1128113 RepID=UPI00352B66CD
MLSQPARQLALCTVACLGVSLSAIMGVPAQAQDQTVPVSVAEYESVLEEITARRSNLALREYYLTQQQAEIASLTQRIEAAQNNDASEELIPLVRTMVAELEKEMVDGLPFRIERRFGLLDSLREDLQGDGLLASDIYRRAMELIGTEVEYGLQVGSYTGNNPINPGTRFAACEQNVESAECDLSDEQEQALESGAVLFDLRDQIYDGNFIHYGRMALLYLERDSSEGYRYNEDTKEWDALSNSELLGLRQNVRIARGESAISTMTAPIRKGERAADAS